ncbi:MAG: hypothetical protein GX424_02130 [Clostridiales bacterium]|nr:hypothetical protein [Clostridiales bacterium]
MKKRIFTALAAVFLALLCMPVTAAAKLLDKDADPPVVASSGSFEAAFRTKMEFGLSGGKLTSAKWTRTQGYTSYTVMGTCKQGETISLSVTGTQSALLKNNTSADLVFNRLSMNLTFFDRNRKVIGEGQKYTSENVKQETLSHQLSTSVPSGTKTVSIMGVFVCRWAGSVVVEEMVAVTAELSVEEEETAAGAVSSTPAVSQPSASQAEASSVPATEAASSAPDRAEESTGLFPGGPWEHAGPLAAVLISLIAVLAAVLGGASGGAAGAAGAAAEPESMVVTVSPNGAQILVVRDPDTGGWVNAETGNPFDMEAHERNFPEQAERYAEYQNRNEELERTGQTAMRQALEKIGKEERESFDAIQKEMDRRRREQLARDQESLEQEMEQARKTSGWGRIIGDTVVNVGDELVDTAESARDAFVWTGETLGTAAGTLVYDPWRAVEQVNSALAAAKAAIGSAGDAVVQAVTDVYRSPEILIHTLAGMGKDITDRQKIWKAVKSVSGIEDFERSQDPNLPLVSRVGHVLTGTFKLYTNLAAAGEGVSALRGGAGSLAGAADEAAALGGRTAKSAAGKVLPVAKPGDSAAIAAFRQAQREGGDKVDDFIAALKSRNPEKINRAALRVQGDNQAIANINRRSNFIKNRFNTTMQNNYSAVDRRVMERLSREYKVDPEQIRVVSATNPNKSLTNVKVGYDRDITFRVGGKDVPADKLQKIYNEEFRNVTGADAARLEQQAVDRTHPEAYGRQASDLPKATNGQPYRIKDSEQVGKTISYKAQHSFTDAAKKVSLGESQREMFDGMRQITKQWNNQVKSAVEYVNRHPGRMGAAKVPPRLEKAIQIMDQINEGVSPMEITQQLRGLSMTPEDTAVQAGEFFTAVMKLK